jgi:hypothetical protein
LQRLLQRFQAVAAPVAEQASKADAAPVAALDESRRLVFLLPATAATELFFTLFTCFTAFAATALLQRCLQRAKPVGYSLAPPPEQPPKLSLATLPNLLLSFCCNSAVAALFAASSLQSSPSHQ